MFFYFKYRFGHSAQMGSYIFSDYLKSHTAWDFYSRLMIPDDMDDLLSIIDAALTSFDDVSILLGIRHRKETRLEHVLTQVFIHVSEFNVEANISCHML